MPHPLQALLYALVAYFGLQIVLNFIVRSYVSRSLNRASAALLGSFWASVLNAIFFIAVAVYFKQSGLAPVRDPGPDTLWWAIGGVALGVALWYFSAKARGFGIRLFGRGNLIAGEDAILRFPPRPAYLSLGVANQAFLQPLGRELFLRGVFLPLAVAHYGWGWGIAATLLIEVMPRLNVVWLPVTLLHGVAMCGLFYLTGGALTGLIASAVSGFLHSIALAYITVRGDASDEVSAAPVRKTPRRLRADGDER